MMDKNDYQGPEQDFEPILEEDVQISSSYHPTYKSFLNKSSTNDHIESNLFLNLSQTFDQQIGITYEDLQKLQSFDSRLVSPGMQMTSSEVQKSKCFLIFRANVFHRQQNLRRRQDHRLQER
jgi:hypothetical protein